MPERFFKRNYNILIIILLFSAGLIVYSNSFFNSFHFDDESSIIKNPAIRYISNLRGIWHFWPTRFITYLSVALNYHWGGLRIWRYHEVNFLLHAGSAILVWWLAGTALVTPVIKNSILSAYHRPIALFSGLLFLLHPIQTQPVNYIIQRATLLASLFYIASVGLYIKARLRQEENPDSSFWKVFYCGSLAAALAGAFSKEMVVSLPLTICLCEFYFFKPGKRISWKLPVPFFAVALVIPLTMLVTRSVDFAGMHRATEVPPGISVGNYFLTELRVILTYMRLLFIPLNQNLDYDYPVARSIFGMPVLFSVLALIIIISAGIGLFRRYKLVSFGIFWFFITLLPESSFIPIKDVIVEHRLYLSMAGFSLFLVSGLYYLFKGRAVKWIVILLSLLAVCYSVMTYQRNKVWENGITLWSDVLLKSPLKARAYNNRGFVYQSKGDLDLALADYSRAIALDPKFAGAYNNRGYLYQSKGDLDLALADYNRAIEISPSLADAYNNRGYLYQSKGDLDLALADYSLAIEIRPGLAEAYNNRGNVYFSKGQLDLALADYSRAIEITPGLAEAYINRAIAYRAKGDLKRADSDSARAAEIRRRHPGEAVLP